MRIEQLRGRRVAVWGAGREARAAVQALRARLPGQPLALIVRPDERGEGRDIAGPATAVHALDPDAAFLAQFDVVVKSPGISPYKSPVPQAIDRGVGFVSGSALWFAENPSARTIAVTGTKGKSTTTALIAHLLRAAGKRVALCGNIGMPLLELLDPQPPPPDFWVMELSSFQTRDLEAVPEVAVVLSLFPEHLDWHGSVERYYADKLALLGTPGRRPHASVLNALQAWPKGVVPETGVSHFGDAGGYHLHELAIWHGRQRVFGLEQLPLPGAHNALNACAALAAIDAAGVSAIELAPALRSFKPLPHRLQPLGRRDGLDWVDDSISTTPHATLAALAHYRGRDVTVLVGGYDRGLDWSEFARAIGAAPPHAIVTMGQNGPRIHALLAATAPAGLELFAADSLDAATAQARKITPPGGLVLLSPGAPSFGRFKDYVERGRRFAALAGFDPDLISSIEGLGL